MKNLLKRQQQFLSQVINGEKATMDIIGAKDLSVSQALAVYQEAYLSRLYDALLEKYKSVWTVVGDMKFRSLCKEYIQHHKSRTYNLDYYGQEFPKFLKAEQTRQKSLEPFLSELAEFERLFDQVFHAQTQVSKYKEKVFQVNENSCFKLVSYLKLPVFEYNIYEIWQAAQKNSKPPQLIKASEYLLFSKHGDSVFVKVIDRFSFCLFISFLEGKHLSDALKEASEGQVIHPDQVEESFKILRQSQALIEIF